jgi:adenosylcobinamide-GDP ribazoletransferase
MTALREHLDLFTLALQRATVLRVGAATAADAEPDDASVRASQAHLPGAGWVIGIAACLVFALFGLLLRASSWGAAIAAIAASTVTAILTRGRGETAVFRWAERLQLLAAPGTSGAGALALFLLLAARICLLAAIASLSEAGVLATLFAAQVVSRLAPVLLARSLNSDVPPRAVQVGAAWCLVPLVLMVPVASVGALALGVIAATLACYGTWRIASRQAEPADRDVLAGAQQVCEVAFYLGAAIGL